MKIHDPAAYIIATELEIIERRLQLADARVLELGCGRAWMTRQIAERFHPQRIVATEVDRIQHEKNLLIDDLPRVEFIYGGAESIPLPDGCMDVVLMLKSLHHVPRESMEQALREIARVLRPDGIAYISEPVYAGTFNEILRLFNDERVVREKAFEAVSRSVAQGTFELLEQLFFNAPGDYRNFAEFADRMLNVTHTRHRIDAQLYERIREAFEVHMSGDGAHFMKPSRVDLLKRPG
jgi:ubiquinone/menaquinone biosynthesis C-methylase UbiE